MGRERVRVFSDRVLRLLRSEIPDNDAADISDMSGSRAADLVNFVPPFSRQDRPAAFVSDIKKAPRLLEHVWETICRIRKVLFPCATSKDILPTFHLWAQS